MFETKHESLGFIDFTERSLLGELTKGMNAGINLTYFNLQFRHFQSRLIPYFGSKVPIQSFFFLSNWSCSTMARQGNILSRSILFKCLMSQREVDWRGDRVS